MGPCQRTLQNEALLSKILPKEKIISFKQACEEGHDHSAFTVSLINRKIIFPKKLHYVVELCVVTHEYICVCKSQGPLYNRHM